MTDDGTVVGTFASRAKDSSLRDEKSGGARASSLEANSMNRGFLHAGHVPKLVAAVLIFEVSFMVWQRATLVSTKA